MKTRFFRAMIIVSAGLLFTAFGCENVVTDVNAYMNEQNKDKEALGIPVNHNEDYVEAAYDPVKDAAKLSDISEDGSEIVKENDNAVSDKPDSKETFDVLTEDDKKDTSKDTDKVQKDDDLNDDQKDTTEGAKANAENDTDTETAEGVREGDSDTLDTSVADADTPDEQDPDDPLAPNVDDPQNNASVIPEDFDPEFYASTYPDVVAVFGNSPEVLYKHYQDYGKAEGRSCNSDEYALLNEAATE